MISIVSFLLIAFAFVCMVRVRRLSSRGKKIEKKEIGFWLVASVFLLSGWFYVLWVSLGY
jgi:hypothetical protein